MGDHSARSGPRRSGIAWFFRNPDTGELAIAQAPNVPLWAFLAATAVLVSWVGFAVLTAGRRRRRQTTHR